MMPSVDHTDTAPKRVTPFDLWLAQKLRSTYEPVVHEAIPDAILDAIRLPGEDGRRTAPRFR